MSCKEALKRSFVQLKLGYSGDPRILKMSQPWDICWGQLQAQSRARPRERICVCRQQSWRVEIPKTFRTRIIPAQAPDIRHELQDVVLNFTGSAFPCGAWFLPFGTWVFTLCLCTLKSVQLKKKLYRASSLRDCLTLWRNSAIIPINSVRTVNDYGRNFWCWTEYTCIDGCEPVRPRRRLWLNSSLFGSKLMRVE